MFFDCGITKISTRQQRMSKMIECNKESVEALLNEMDNMQLKKYIALCDADKEIYATQDSFVFSRIVLAKRALATN